MPKMNVMDAGISPGVSDRARGGPGPLPIDLPLNVQKGPEIVDWEPDWDRARLRPPAAGPGRDPRGGRDAGAGRAADDHARRRDDYSFQFLMEEVAVAVQYRLPFVLVMLDNTYMGLIRQAEKYGDDENYAVDLSFDNGETVGIDHVGVMEAMGALGRRVTEPGDIADTLRWAADTSEEHRLPVLVEIMTERDTDAAMGVAIDAINEYEPVRDGVAEQPGAVVGALPERD